jgi:hypothetical protein
MYLDLQAAAWRRISDPSADPLSAGAAYAEGVKESNAMVPQDLRARVFALRDEILAAAERNGARNVRLFGSVARGDAGSDSDVDLLVEFEPGRTLLDQAGLILELRDLLGVQVDVVDAGGLKPRDAHIRAEAVSL